MNYSITAAATYTTLDSFMSKKNKSLTIGTNLQIDLITQLKYQATKLQGQTLQLLLLCPYLSQHTKFIKKKLESNSTDVLISKTLMVSSCVACEYDDYWWLVIVQEG
jgi:hypothetical protein